jgi:hypothetical protein
MRNSEMTQLTISQYAIIYKELEDFCIKNTKVLLFGEFGNASFPSISDLDVFICLKDDSFISDYNKIINFIDADKTRQYVFFHDPLIIPERILPFLNQFHTLYNLKFTFEREAVLIPFSNPNQLNFLNTIWTTYLMGIGPSILINEQFGIRDKLLVLKNICQSIVNIDANSEALLFSDKIRNQVMEGELSLSDINEIFEDKLRELYDKANTIKINDKLELKNRDKFRVGKNKLFFSSYKNDFSISKKEICIVLNNEIFNLFGQIYFRKSTNRLLKEYIENSSKVNRHCKDLGISYPFISPFGYQFYRTDLKFTIKQKIFSL